MAKRKRRARGEGSLFYDDSIERWVARQTPEGGTRPIKRTGKTQAEARKKLRKALADWRPGLPREAGTLTVSKYLAHWIENVARTSVRASSWPSYERCVRLHISPRLGHLKLTELRTVHIEEMYAAMARDGMSGGNQKKCSEVLGAALNHALRTEMIRSNPVSITAKPKVSREEVIPFNQNEVKRLLEESESHRLHGMIALAFATGARLGELAGLGWDAVDLTRERIHIRRSLSVATGTAILTEPKSKRGTRTVDLPRFAVVALDHRKVHAEQEGTIGAGTVFSTKTGGFLHKSSFTRQIWMPLCERAEVKYRKFHSTRHTHVSELLSKGVPVVEVARRVGDSPETILKVYWQFIPAIEAGVTDKLDELYS